MRIIGRYGGNDNTKVIKSMKGSFLKKLCCIAMLTVSIASKAQDLDFSAPDPLAGFSEDQMEKIIEEYGKPAVYAAQSEDIAYLKLDPYTSLALGRFKSEYNRNIRALKQSNKSGSDYRKLSKQYKALFRDQMISLVGEEKFEQWEYFVEMLPERKYMKEYGFTANQVVMYSHKAFKETQMEEIRQLQLSPEIALMMGELITNYKSESNNIKDVAYTNKGRRLAAATLQESHENNVRILIGEEKYQIWKSYIDETPKRKYMKRYDLTESQVSQYSMDAFLWASWQEIQSLKLSPLDALKMGELKNSYLKSIDAIPLDQEGIWDRRRELRKKYRSDVKELIGEEKFKKWMEFPSQRMEKMYLQEYGFTEEQYMQYQSLENQQAVVILCIKTSPIPHEEKQERIAQVKSEKIEKLRQILSVEQFDKWYGAYLENEIFNKTQRK